MVVASHKNSCYKDTVITSEGFRGYVKLLSMDTGGGTSLLADLAKYCGGSEEHIYVSDITLPNLPKVSDRKVTLEN